MDSVHVNDEPASPRSRPAAPAPERRHPASSEPAPPSATTTPRAPERSPLAGVKTLADAEAVLAAALAELDRLPAGEHERRIARIERALTGLLRWCGDMTFEPPEIGRLGFVWSQRGFGRYLRALRVWRRMTQGQVAIRGGCSEDTVRRIERGQFSPTMQTLLKLCAGLDVGLTTLIEGCEMKGRAPLRRELEDMLRGRPPHQVELCLALVSGVLRQFDDMEERVTGFDLQG